ncbi:MAG TPA: TolC family protein [Polyangia bacterium]|jgi:outer membrane protein TolC|nr:TolC family protein [Polyangia bacterium]
MYRMFGSAFRSLVVASLALLIAGPARAAADETPQGSTPPVPFVPATPLAVHESQPAPLARITFDEAIRRALERNPTVGVALEEIQRANALVTESRSGWLPTLMGSGSFTRLEGDRPPHQANPVLDANQFYGQLTLTVPLVAAQGWTAERHAKDQVHVSEASAADVRRLVAQATGNAFLAVIAQRQQLKSNDTAIANAKAHSEYAHTRLVGGIGRSIDDVRAQQDLATVLANREAVLTGLARAEEALGVLIGGSEPVDAVETVELGALPSLAAALDEAAAHRTDVVTQRARVAAAETLRKDVWAYYAPYLSAVGQPFVQSGQAVLPNFGWQAALLLTLPFYDGGQRTGLSHERDAQLAQSRLGLEAAVRQARADVRVAFEAMLHADQALTATREAASLAHRAYDLAVTAYKAGATSNLEVIDAARQARDADSSAAIAGDVARRARLDLLVASGRFP